QDRARARRPTKPEAQDHPARRRGGEGPEEDERRYDRAGGSGGSSAGALHEERYERVDAEDRRSEDAARQVGRGRLPAPEDIGRHERMPPARLEPGEEDERGRPGHAERGADDRARSRRPGRAQDREEDER